MITIIFYQALIFAILLSITILLYAISERHKIWDNLFHLSLGLLVLYCAGIAYYWILHPLVKKGCTWMMSIFI